MKDVTCVIPQNFIFTFLEFLSSHTTFSRLRTCARCPVVYSMLTSISKAATIHVFNTFMNVVTARLVPRVAVLWNLDTVHKDLASVRRFSRGE